MEHDETDKPLQPDSTEQSGSTGRPTEAPDGSKGKDTGQGRYGQSGLGGKQPKPDKTRYEQSGPSGAQQDEPGSNVGSGRADREVDGVDPPADKLRQGK